MIEITSRKNKLIVDTLALHEKKERDKTGLFFTEGAKLLGEALSVGMKPLRVFATDNYINSHGEITELDCEVIRVTREVYEKITDESAPEGVLAVFEKSEIKLKDKRSSVLLLESIQDPGNLGTLIRTAVAFGVSQILTVGCADVYSAKTVRSAMGGVFKIKCTAFSDIDSAVEYARGVTDKVVATALAADSVSIEEADTSNATLMIGNEGRGLTARAMELADIKVIIPIENIESLNASVAGAVCMYDSMLKRKARQ